MIWENVDEINERVNDAVFTIIDTRFDVRIEKRENFDATTERVAISIQNIDFFDVANEVIENEIFEIVFDEITDDVNINVDSLDENVAKNVDIAIIAFDVSIDTVDDCFDVKKNVNSAIWLDAVVAIIASIAFANSAISFRNEIEDANIAFVLNFW